MFNEVSSYRIVTMKLGDNAMIANKEAVICHWRIGECTFSAICCHIADHNQNCEK